MAENINREKADEILRLFRSLPEPERLELVNKLMEIVSIRKIEGNISQTKLW